MCKNSCKLCKNLVISDSVTVVTVNGVDTLLVDIPLRAYDSCKPVCVVVAQNIPTTATITMPVAISVGGVTTTVYPIVDCNCLQITACMLESRTRYKLRLNAGVNGAVFKAGRGVFCRRNNTVISIPVTE